MKMILVYVFAVHFGIAQAHTKNAEIQAEGASLEQLDSYFPHAVTSRKSKMRIDFCPDNTCDRFVGKNIPESELADYAFLYIYFFSDYFVLADFRKNASAEKQADVILAKYGLNFCHREIKKESAACLLLHAEKRGNFRLSMVRQDEKGEHVILNSMLRRLSKDDLQRAKKP